MRLEVLFALLLVALVAGERPKPLGKLPGQKFDVNFKQYSGYLNASQTRKLHYWLVQAEGDAKEAPLIVWLNGGPGCSSLVGLLTELGPFRVRDDGKTLYRHKYAWNRVANVLFLESPAGTGFSYATDGKTKTNDEQSASDNYAALLDFFRLFPEFEQNKLYIMGQSYGGVYVPRLAEKIVNGGAKFKRNLVGVAVGNGALSWPLMHSTGIVYAWANGFVDTAFYRKFEKDCCGGCVTNCLRSNSAKQSSCAEEYSFQLNSRFYMKGLNYYNVNDKCWPPPPSENGSLIKGEMANSYRCLNMTATHTYLNWPSVRTALGIPKHLPSWLVCSDEIDGAYKKSMGDQKMRLRKLLNAGVRALIYNGDADFVCSALMGQEFSSGMGLKLLKSKHAWNYDRQVAGFWTAYKGLDFVTVRGAGHAVPADRPKEALDMISTFLKEKPLPTPTPTSNGAMTLLGWAGFPLFSLPLLRLLI